jgi:phage terminase large subunit
MAGNKNSGRPLALTEALADQIGLALSNGITREMAAKYARVSYSTFYLWYHRGKREFERRERGEVATREQEKSEAIYLYFYNQIEQSEVDAVVGWQQIVNAAAKQDPGFAMRMLRLRDPKGYSEQQPLEDDSETKADSGPFELPASVLAPSFLDAYDDIREHAHTEYVFYGGRGSTKSSFISLMFIWLIKNNPGIHLLAVRQVGNTLRQSVYAQIQWAINELGLESQFRCITNPLEITYIPTGQKIFFRGMDEPGKLKSLKTPFGYIGAVWFEELDQYHGEEAIRKAEQSAIRGGDLAYIFKSFNPPISAGNWANKYARAPKANQYQHKSSYLDLGSRIKWLGKPFVEEAEHLKEVNPKAYQHEYLGEVVGTGGMVFENVQLRPITDEEISQFDQVTWGQDWGWYPDPADAGPVHYDAARRILYLFGEYRTWKTNNRGLYDGAKAHGYSDDLLMICDSAEPKSVADFGSFGARARGAEKGPDSVDYSIKWLQGLTAIVIDPARAPYAAEEFVAYEYEQDSDGNFISAYPDRNNHSIDRTRYATNLIWRRRGQ